MKTLTANFTTKKNLKTGATPVWILKIPFPSGTQYLSDDVFTISSWSGQNPVTKAWVKDWGEIDENISSSMAAPQVSDFSVDVIIDPDASPNIDTLLWSGVVEALTCTLYLWFSGLNASTSPPVAIWSGRIADFTKENELLYRIVFADAGIALNAYPGRVLSLADFPNASLNDVGYQMPIAYGSVEKVRAMRLDGRNTTTLMGAINPGQTSITLSQDVSPDDQTIIIDGEEILVTAVSGKDIAACVRGTNVTDTGTYSLMGMSAMTKSCMFTAPNGDVYFVRKDTDLYKQSSGQGAFGALSLTTRNYRAGCVAPNGDVYLCVYGGDIYKQTGGSGSFNALSQTSRAYTGMCAALDGDIYACVENGDIYKQAGGSGNFSALSQTSREWRAMCAAPNGNIYCIVYDDAKIYMQTGGTGDFGAVTDLSRYGLSLSAAPNGDIYAAISHDAFTGANACYYKQTGGTGSFEVQAIPDDIAYGNSSANLSIAVTGDMAIYAGCNDIYFKPGVGTAHDAYATVVVKGAESNYLVADHPVKSIGNVYAKSTEGVLTDITSSCTTYTGQSGDELAGYEGMAVITTTVGYLVGAQVLISFDGYQDDGDGTFTGTPDALIEQPDHIFKHFLYTYFAVATANFSTDAAASFAADGYKFSVVIRNRRKLREWMAYMALQCRCWFRFANGMAYLLYRPDSISSDKTITAAMTRSNDDFTTSMIGPERSPLDEIINIIHLYYDRDWSTDVGDETAYAYQAVERVTESTSISNYGEKEQSELFRFDFVRDSDMATDQANFYLARYANRKKCVTLDVFLDNIEIEFADGVTLAALSNLLCEVRKVNIRPGSGIDGRNDKITLSLREY